MKTYSELLEQFDQLKRDIDVAREREAQLIAQRVMDLLAANGVNVQDLLHGRGSDRRRGAPKYWNPETGATWSGRGRMPTWLIGQDLQRFLINPEEENSGSNSL
ncbi:H-NS histone [Burkholderia ubonensis]|uniref:H-NS histone n=1 Tax=Burkholderia ubonensis TaxID=101571 RepID=A0A103RTL8_9BURK|nr:H-NS histone family protein [Burkholderia ubonensis]KVG73584.1 H-NS histone [Burkholderia ubonensis]